MSTATSAGHDLSVHHGPAPSITPAGLRLGGITGIVGVILFVAAGATLLGPDAPSIYSPTDEARTFFTDNGSNVRLFTFLAPVVSLLLLVFASGLRALLEPTDATGGVLVRVAYSGAVISTAMTTLGLAFWGALSQESVLAALSNDSIQVLTALDTTTFFSLTVWPGALFNLGMSIAILRTSALPSWMGWLGLVAAVASVAGGSWFLTGSLGDLPLLVGFLGFVWTLAVSIGMLRQVGRASA